MGKIEDEIRQKRFESPQQKAYVNIMYTSNWLQDQIKEMFKNYDLTPQQYNVLRILRGRFPNACAAGEIKEVMIDKNPDLTRLIDRLQDKGLVVREVCAHNRRKLEIRITQEGLDLLEAITPPFSNMTAAANNTLTPEEAELLSNLLDKARG